MAKNKSVVSESDGNASPDVTIRNYPASLCHEHESKDGVGSFHTVSFSYKGEWASFILEDDKLSQSFRRDGKPIMDHMNLHLGNASDVRFVSIKTRNDEENQHEYRHLPMFNSTILSSINESRQAYLKSIAV